MRRLLVASAALLGFAGTAYAGQLIEVNPSTTPPTIGDATGTPIPSPKSGFPSPAYNPDPGKIIIRLDGLLGWDVGFVGGAGVMSGNVLGGTPAHPTVLGTGKLDSFQTSGYFRLYFGADGQLMNGLRYGVNAEMRTNFAPGNARGYAASGSPIGNASSNSTASLWFTRRAFGYIGTPQFGYVRFGQGDGPLSLFTSAGITTGESFSTGGWDGDIPDLLPGGTYGGWMFNDIGNEYTSDKIVYLSPTFFGFNVATSFAPSSCALSANQGNTAAGGGNCNQASSPLPSDQSRPRSIFEIAARWQGNAGPVAIDTMFGWQNSAVVNDGLAGGGQNHKGVDAFDGGASLTWLGASIFGHVYGGQLNGTVTPVTVIPGHGGNAGSPKAWSAVGGAQYSTGPWTVGASYWYLHQQGSTGGCAPATPCGMLTFRGWAVGGDYTWAPGFDTFLEYIGGRLHQGGQNLVNSGPGASPNLNNTTNPNGVALTMLIRW